MRQACAVVGRHLAPLLKIAINASLEWLFAIGGRWPHADKLCLAIMVRYAYIVASLNHNFYLSTTSTVAVGNT